MPGHTLPKFRVERGPDVALFLERFAKVAKVVELAGGVLRVLVTLC